LTKEINNPNTTATIVFPFLKKIYHVSLNPLVTP
jgi:hypothetical protein